ncbi:MAG: mevalonate kinase [Streptococcaceae bacterium]|jgi:mevalonate kinase|nr:mevalonate kinase [Streptococcaceae bacterium]
MRTQKVGQGEAHAKLILMGEHSVVYGEPAIALPVQILRMTVTLTEQAFGQYIQDNEMRNRLALMDDDFEGIRQLILRLLEKFHAANMPFSLEIDSNIPRGRGLGASAALATAIVKAFYAFFDKPLREAELLSHVNFSETIMHGRASGIDAATVNSEKPLWFIKDKVTESLDIAQPGFLVIGDTGVRGLTTQAISIVQQKRATNLAETQAQIENLGQLTRDAREQLANSNLTELGSTMTQAQQILMELGVSHPALNNLIEVALRSGALGAKLTGSGLGGVIVALAGDGADAIRISQALSKGGAQNTWIFSL